MGTPIPHQIYSSSEVAEMFAFPDNTGAGQVVGVLGWGSKGAIGIDASERPNVEIILIGEQTNGTVSGELMMDTGILHTFVPDAVIKVYLAISDEAGIVEAVQRATSECNAAVPMDHSA